jgi:hypothetical protein
MGAWGTGPFDNDDAVDFVRDLAETLPENRIGMLSGLCR